MDNELELLKARIEVLERDLRRAIDIASEAVQEAEELAAKAYRCGFREGFDRALAKGETACGSTPDDSNTDVKGPT
jgi:hypothetical protein